MRGKVFHMNVSSSALALLAMTATLSFVDGFVVQHSSLSHAGALRAKNVCAVSSLANSDTLRSRSRRPSMSLKPSARPMKPDVSSSARRRLLLPWGQGTTEDVRLGGRKGLPWRGSRRGFPFMRRAAEKAEDEAEPVDGEYQYEEGEIEEYSDDDQVMDRALTKRLKRSATVFRQVSWLSWWCQTILSTVAFIILLFSNAVTNRSARGNILGNGVALALASLACSAASICWTWGYTLKAKGWRRLGALAEVDDAQQRMRNSLKMGLYINVAGMLLALIGAEQIVGTLVAKVLYSQGFQPSVMVGNAGAAEVAQAQFRALDVFIVQANTNTLLSHFCSLAASLWLLARTPRLAQLAKGVF